MVALVHGLWVLGCCLGWIKCCFFLVPHWALFPLVLLVKGFSYVFLFHGMSEWTPKKKTALVQPSQHTSQNKITSVCFKRNLDNMMWIWKILTVIVVLISRIASPIQAYYAAPNGEPEIALASGPMREIHDEDLAYYFSFSFSLWGRNNAPYSQNSYLDSAASA